MTATRGEIGMAALVLMTLSLTLMAMAVSRIPRAIPSVPVINVRIDAPTLRDRLVCPGTLHAITARYEVVRPTVLEVIDAVVSGDGYGTLPQTVSAPVYRILPRSGMGVQESAWIVPDLPPGAYLRVVAFTAHNQEAEPGFVWVPFRIASACVKQGIVR